MKREKIKCTVCTHDASFYNKLSEVTLYYCANCKHFFTDQDSIKNKEDYSPEYFTERHPSWFENPDLKLFDFIYKYIERFNFKSPSILDVGCGNGNFLKYLKKRSNNFSLTGIDYSKNSPEENITFLSGDIFNADFKKEFDVIISLAVIEHIWSVRSYVLRLRQLCRKGGLIILMTPNNSSLLYGFARKIYHFGIKSPMEKLYDKHHLNHFSKNSLECLFKNCSLKVLENHISQFNINSLSIPKSSLLMSIIYNFGLHFIFFVEKFFWKKHMQTIIASKAEKNE